MNTSLFLTLWAAFAAVSWLSPKNQDIGTIPAGEVYQTAFVYQNTGTEAITIDNVRTTCGCTVPDWNQHLLPPGQKDTLRVLLERNNRGRFRQKIKVFFHHQRQAEVLTLRGKVE